ncbi:hypothetical protein [Clostridium sp.]|uniref:DUF6892 domain-containing protein n=1 Tax=Clostridium sp. TaxID=1506 RepID=UPI0034645548
MHDYSGMFKDFAFKLIVIDSLLNKQPSFEDELKLLKEKYVDSYEWYTNKGIIKEILTFFENIILTEEDLEKVTELCFDGGNDVYFLLQPDWDGEDDLLNISSVKGFERLVNLKEVEYISMCHPKTLQPFIEFGISVQ